MTQFAYPCSATIMSIQPAGDGSPGTAAAVNIPSAYTILLAELPVSGTQAIKLSEGNVGDRVDVYVISRTSTGSNQSCKLRVYDSDNNSLAGTDDAGAMTHGSMAALQKIIPTPYSESGFTSGQVGTWLGRILPVTYNYAST